MDQTTHRLRAALKMEGMALVQIGAHRHPVEDVLYPATTPEGLEAFGLATQFAPTYRRIRTLKGCEAGMKTLAGIKGKVIGQGEPLTQADLSQIRLLYKQFEDLIGYLMAMADDDIHMQIARNLMSVRKASRYFATYARKANHLLSFVDMRSISVD